MNIKRIYKNSDLKRMLLHFIGWNALFYAIFFIGSISFHIYKQDAQEARTYQETRRRLNNQLKQIETLLSFVDIRLSHATTDEDQKIILQDRYSDSMGGKSYPKILNIYHIQNVQTGVAIGAYGKTTLEHLPPPSFFETQLDSNQKISITVDKKYFNIFSPRTTSLTNQELPSFLMLKVPLEELLIQGVSLSKPIHKTPRLVFPEYNITFFLNAPKKDLIREYINVYWPYYLLMLMFTGLFSLYFAGTRKQVKAKIFDGFRSQLTTLKDKTHEQTEEIALLQEDIKMHELENMALTSSYKIQEDLKNAHTLKLHPIKTRLEKKMTVLVDDLLQMTQFDPALESLLEMGQSAQKDFNSLTIGAPGGEDNRKILLEDLIKISIQGLGNLIFSKNISYEINIDSTLSNIQGDLVILQIILMNIFYKSIERLKTSGKIKISALSTPDQENMIQLDVWDNGYNFDDSKLLQYAATNRNDGNLFNLDWKDIETFIDLYGGQIYQKNHSATGNITSIYLPMTQEKENVTIMEQLDNVIPFVKA